MAAKAVARLTFTLDKGAPTGSFLEASIPPRPALRSCRSRGTAG